MPPNISEKIYCTAELRFVNCKSSTEKKKIHQQQQPSNSDRVITSVNSNRIKGKGWTINLVNFKLK